MHQGGAREEGGRRGARGEVSAKLSNVGGMGYCSASESSSSESMSGGSGSKKNVGRPLGVHTSSVTLKIGTFIIRTRKSHFRLLNMLDARLLQLNANPITCLKYGLLSPLFTYAAAVHQISRSLHVQKSEYGRDT